MGAGKSLKGQEKNSGEEMSRTRVKALTLVLYFSLPNFFIIRLDFPCTHQLPLGLQGWAQSGYARCVFRSFRLACICNSAEQIVKPGSSS